MGHDFPINVNYPPEKVWWPPVLLFIFYMNRIEYQFKDNLNNDKMQITSYEDLTPDKIIFKEAKEYKVKDSKVKYKRIGIETLYPSGKKGALIIESPLLLSFGVNEKRSQETGKLVGYSIPVCLWSKDSEPNTQEKAFFDVINNVMGICRLHLESEFGADLASSMSSPFYYKQVEYTDKKEKKKTKRDPSAAPVLYAKLIYSEKSKKILSLFKTKGKKELRATVCKNRAKSKFRGHSQKIIFAHILSIDRHK